MLSNPSGRAFSRLFMWGRASTAEPNDKWIRVKELFRLYVWLPSTTSNTATPTNRYRFSISRGQLRTITDPPMLWPISFEKEASTKSMNQIRMLYLLKKWDILRDPGKGFESVRRSQRQERQSTSRCRSLLWMMSFLRIFGQEKFPKSKSNMGLLPCRLASKDNTPHSPFVVSVTSLAKQAKLRPEYPAPWWQIITVPLLSFGGV